MIELIMDGHSIHDAIKLIFIVFMIWLPFIIIVLQEHEKKEDDCNDPRQKF